MICPIRKRTDRGNMQKWFLEMVYWTLHCWKCPTNLVLFVNLSVRPTVRSHWKISDLREVSMGLESHTVKKKKISKPDFWKKSLGLGGPKSPKNDPKTKFLGFWHKSNPYISLQCENINGLLTFLQKPHVI